MSESLIERANRAPSLDEYTSAAEVIAAFCARSPEESLIPSCEEAAYNSDPRYILALRLKKLARSLVTISTSTKRRLPANDGDFIARWSLPVIKSNGVRMSGGGILALGLSDKYFDTLCISTAFDHRRYVDIENDWCCIPGDDALGAMLKHEEWDQHLPSGCNAIEKSNRKGFIGVHRPFNDASEAVPYVSLTGDLTRLVYAASTGLQLGRS